MSIKNPDGTLTGTELWRRGTRLPCRAGASALPEEKAQLRFANERGLSPDLRLLRAWPIRKTNGRTKTHAWVAMLRDAAGFPIGFWVRPLAEIDGSGQVFWTTDSVERRAEARLCLSADPAQARIGYAAVHVVYGFDLALRVAWLLTDIQGLGVDEHQVVTPSAMEVLFDRDAWKTWQPARTTALVCVYAETKLARDMVRRLYDSGPEIAEMRLPASVKSYASGLPQAWEFAIYERGLTESGVDMKFLRHWNASVIH